jgi:plasmid stabilization system protein ParE
VAQVVYAARALADVERLFAFLAEKDIQAAEAAARTIRDAVEVLGRHPLIGRATREPLRELVISYGASGYLALYRFLPERAEVRILGIRHQRELDYPP